MGPHRDDVGQGLRGTGQLSLLRAVQVRLRLQETLHTRGSSTSVGSAAWPNTSGSWQQVQAGITREALPRQEQQAWCATPEAAGRGGRTHAKHVPEHAQERLLGNNGGIPSWHLRGSAGQADHRLVDEGLLHQVADERQVDAVNLRR